MCQQFSLRCQLHFLPCKRVPLKRTQAKKVLKVAAKENHFVPNAEDRAAAIAALRARQLQKRRAAPAVDIADTCADDSLDADGGIADTTGAAAAADDREAARQADRVAASPKRCAPDHLPSVRYHTFRSFHRNITA